MPPKVKREPGETESAPKRSRKSVEKGTEEYQAKRDRNNVAVKKSRERSRQKAAETQDRVEILKNENAELEQKVQLLQKELSVLKDLFLTQARSEDGGDQGHCQQQMGGPGSSVNQKAVRNDHKYTSTLS